MSTRSGSVLEHSVTSKGRLLLDMFIAIKAICHLVNLLVSRLNRSKTQSAYWLTFGGHKAPPAAVLRHNIEVGHGSGDLSVAGLASHFCPGYGKYCEGNKKQPRCNDYCSQT